MQLSDVLTAYEAEHFIESLQVFEITEFGSRKWFQQDEVLQKLNLQAHVNAMMRSDEFIMEALCTFDKTRSLIYDLIMTEMWKQFIYPHVKTHLSEITAIRSYTLLQHEAIVCNLLQVAFFHRSAVESGDSYILEVIDYCYRKLANLMQKQVNYLESRPPPKKIVKKSIEYYRDRNRVDELEEQRENVEFQIQMMCLSIIRFITDFVKYLPINVVHQLIVENDIYQILIPLIEDKPWLRQNAQDEREVFEQSKWVMLQKSEYSKLPKIEAQVWITIYNLFMEPESRRKYELTEFKKSNLLRLRKFMNELLLDQIPQLVDMLRSLEELSIMPVQSIGKVSVVIQQMPELRAQICKDRNWKSIAEKQITEFFPLGDVTIQEDMKRLAELYSNSIFEGIIDGYKCQKCQKDATKRCSRCKQVWYCSKDCQVSHWSTHKLECGQVGMKKDVNSQEQQKQVQTSELDKID